MASSKGAMPGMMVKPVIYWTGPKNKPHSNKEPDKGCENGKASDHLIWFFPDSQQEQSGQKDYRQILPQDRFWGQTAEKTACNKGHRHSHKPQKNPLCEQGAVLDIDNTDAHGNCECDGAAKNGRYDNACVTADKRISSQIHRELIASHINSEDPAQQSRIHSHGFTKRGHRILKAGGNKRSEADNARHGKGGSAQIEEAFFKFSTKAQSAAEEPIQPADNCAGRHDPHDYLFHLCSPSLTAEFLP